MDLPKLIRLAGNGNRCYHVLVYGGEGVGKSSFAMQELFEVVRPAVSNDRAAWKKVLELTMFDLEQIVKTLRSYMEADSFAPGIICDDSGLHLSGLRYALGRRDRYMMAMYESLADTARTATGAIFYTAPSPRRVTRNIRARPQSYNAKIIKTSGGNDREARIYQVYWDEFRNRAGKRRVGTIKFNVMLPDWVYKQYMLRRKGAAYEILSLFEDALAEKEDRAKEELKPMGEELEHILE